MLGVSSHGLLETAAVLRVLFGETVPTVERAFDTLGDQVETHLESALLARWLGRDRTMGRWDPNASSA